MEKKSRSRILFFRTSYQFLGLKILKLFDTGSDPGSCQPWIRDGKSRILDPGSGINIPESGSVTLAGTTIIVILCSLDALKSTNFVISNLNFDG